jgi:hypothetical protein
LPSGGGSRLYGSGDSAVLWLWSGISIRRAVPLPAGLLTWRVPPSASMRSLRLTSPRPLRRIGSPDPVIADRQPNDRVVCFEFDVHDGCVTVDRGMNPPRDLPQLLQNLIETLGRPRQVRPRLISPGGLGGSISRISDANCCWMPSCRSRSIHRLVSSAAATIRAGSDQRSAALGVGDRGRHQVRERGEARLGGRRQSIALGRPRWAGHRHPSRGPSNGGKRPEARPVFRTASVAPDFKTRRCRNTRSGRSRTRTWDLFLIREAL